jgi:hypothetical protein
MKHSGYTIFLIALLALAGCSDGPVITITNHSSITLSNVVLTGSGFTNNIEILAPGSRHKLTVYPHGESGLRVVFDAAGRRIDSGEQGYFEGGNNYQVAVIVNTNLDVSVSSDLRTY